jgi:hypothetical protein
MFSRGHLNIILVTYLGSEGNIKNTKLLAKIANKWKEIASRTARSDTLRRTAIK